MRESRYLSVTFQEDVLSKFLASLKTDKSKNDYNTLICSICDYCKKDFLDLQIGDAKAFFEEEIRKIIAGSITKQTVTVKLARLLSISNYIIKNDLIDGYLVNPFTNVEIPETEKAVDPKSIPSIDEMDHLLELAKEDTGLYVALSLIIRCALTSGELCKLKRSNLITFSDGTFALDFRYQNSQKRIKLPEDIVDLIDSYMTSRPHAGEYLFYNKRGNPMRMRDMENLYAKTMGPDNQFTMQDVRNGAIVYMLKCGASQKQAADYVGISPGWMSRYNEALSSMSLAAVDYVNIRISNPLG